MTFCGDSAASDLTMKNVPWHSEVLEFCKQLCQRLPDYEVSCEHEHSNCVLISHKKVSPRTCLVLPIQHRNKRKEERKSGEDREGRGRKRAMKRGR